MREHRTKWMNVWCDGSTFNYYISCEYSVVSIYAVPSLCVYVFARSYLQIIVVVRCHCGRGRRGVWFQFHRYVFCLLCLLFLSFFGFLFFFASCVSHHNRLWGSEYRTSLNLMTACSILRLLQMQRYIIYVSRFCFQFFLGSPLVFAFVRFVLEMQVERKLTHISEIVCFLLFTFLARLSLVFGFGTSSSRRTIHWSESFANGFDDGT